MKKLLTTLFLWSTFNLSAMAQVPCTLAGSACSVTINSQLDNAELRVEVPADFFAIPPSFIKGGTKELTLLLPVTNTGQVNTEVTVNIENAPSTLSFKQGQNFTLDVGETKEVPLDLTITDNQEDQIDFQIVVIAVEDPSGPGGPIIIN